MTPTPVEIPVVVHTYLGPIRAMRSDEFTDSRSAMQHDLNHELRKPMLQKGLVAGNGMNLTVVHHRLPSSSSTDICTGTATPPPCCLDWRAGATIQHAR